MEIEPRLSFRQRWLTGRIKARSWTPLAPEKETVTNLATVALLVAMFCAFFGLGFFAGKETGPPPAGATSPAVIESPAVYSERV